MGWRVRCAIPGWDNIFYVTSIPACAPVSPYSIGTRGFFQDESAQGLKKRAEAENDRRRTSSSLLLIKRYNLFKVLACSTSFFHLSLSCATFFQLRTSSHRNLGLPVGLLAMGFHLLIFFTLLSSVMRST